jgi:hypothetical protein
LLHFHCTALVTASNLLICVTMPVFAYARFLTV